MDAYLFLQQIRFGNKLILQVDLKQVEGQVTPLALQMLIENAIKHNVIAEEQPLTIRVYQEGNSIVVENNLQTKKIIAEDSTGIGLENIKRRYSFLTERPVEVVDSVDKFRVRLPLL